MVTVRLLLGLPYVVECLIFIGFNTCKVRFVISYIITIIIIACGVSLKVGLWKKSGFVGKNLGFGKKNMSFEKKNLSFKKKDTVTLTGHCIYRTLNA